MPEYEENRKKLNEAGQAIDNLFPGLGFCVLIFDFNESGTSIYISNARRIDMIKALRETADRFERSFHIFIFVQISISLKA